ncbi:tyrosine-type recombinase/integrase [Idiomarina sp. Sol25]|uniref:tyrosine-type recombinase/integrase n=1 Tax=Idiomarina sp. Sol25 TaxID=3064000 RepID=UPI00294B672C|nr:tyrosine-type recombinase/integrase [Idiomarina sp. Sol25]MDV6326806.1 tyrosine-type recombinase/integrase [Idiomarina sp. Sol25]
METSISKTAAHKLLNKGKVKDQIGCTKIKGFHLLKVRDSYEKTLKSGKTKKVTALAAWRLRYTDALGKRVNARIGDYPALDPQQAAEIALEWRLGMTKGEADPLAKKREKEAEARAQSRLKVGKYFDEVYTPALEEYAGKERARATLNKIRNHFQSLWHIPMSDLTVQDVRRWESEMLEREFKRKGKTYKGVWYTTRRGYFGAFAAMLKYAAGEKNGHVNDEPVLKEFPLKGVKLKGATQNEKERQDEHNEEYDLARDLLTDSEREKIQAGLKRYGQELVEQRNRSLRLEKNKHLPDLSSLAYADWFIPFCHIARLTGMRPSDALNLRWQNIKQLHAKASEYAILQFTPKKTNHHPNPTEVQFPIFGELAEVLGTWCKQQGNPTSGLVFPSDKMAKKGLERAWDRKVYDKKWKKVLKLAGVRQDIHFYSFRHNFISDWVKQGLAPLEIAALVGHKDGDMIARHYFKQDLNRSVAIMKQFYADEQPQPSKAKAAGDE